MGWAKTGLAGIVVVAAVAGCQNKMYDQNKELMDENKALRDQNDAIRRQQAQASPPPPVQQQPVVQQQAYVPPATRQAAPPPPSAPRQVEQIGGLETNVNRAGDTVVQLPSDVFFDSGQATLKQASKASLDKVVAALKSSRYAAKKIRVDGHTDSTPIRVSKWQSNMELSEARAAAVKDYLVSKGIPASRLTTKGWGDTKPRGTDLAKNRRVEIVLLAAPEPSMNK
jgi:outer membrane protein OmpA-like peptidoglycan-associated protein